MSEISKFLVPAAEEVAQIREDILRLRTCGLQGHSALFHGHAEALMLLIEQYERALAYFADERQATCPDCGTARGQAHAAACWLQELAARAITGSGHQV